MFPPKTKIVEKMKQDIKKKNTILGTSKRRSKKTKQETKRRENVNGGVNNLQVPVPFPLDTGLNGLVNIRNIWYMNPIVQCLRLPKTIVIEKMKQDIKKKNTILGTSKKRSKQTKQETRRKEKVNGGVNNLQVPVPFPLNTGLNGLVNIRNNCYMNSIIQCLRHIPCVRDFFLSREYIFKITRANPKLILHFGDLVRKMSTGSDCPLLPQDFYNKVIHLIPNFKSGRYEDSNEFFLTLFNILSNDILDSVNTDTDSSQEQVSFHLVNQQKSSFFIEQFFYQIRTICTCCNEKVMKFDTENLFILNLPLRGPVPLERLLNEAVYNFDGSTMRCKNCGKIPTIERQISYQPRTLTVMLKRYHRDIDGMIRKINTRCAFPLDNLRIGMTTYKLWGICLHKGTMNAGHYTAVCRNVLDDKWYKYNDETVESVDLTEMVFDREVYMFFYEINNEKLVGFV